VSGRRRPGYYYRLYLREHAPNAGGKLTSPGSRQHLRARADQELVPEQASQATQVMAHRGLFYPGALGRSRDVTFGDERVEGDEQVQVQARQGTVIEEHCTSNRFKSRSRHRPLVRPGSAHRNAIKANEAAFAIGPASRAVSEDRRRCRIS
jgi:hypothetical protein